MGEIYRTRDRAPERGGKPGFYRFARLHRRSRRRFRLVCAPVYGETLGLRTEVPVGIDDGFPRDGAIRCDFLALLFKRTLTGFVGTLASSKLSARSC